MALKPRHGKWAYGADAFTPADAARVLAWRGPDDPGDWRPVTRTFRDGHAETWHAADATLGWWGPDGFTRLVVVTADPGTLPDKATWYLATNLPRPGGPREAGQPAPGSGPGRDHQDLRHPALDRTGLQAGQRRTGLGRLPGPLRHRDPPPPGAGQLRVQLLLERLVHRAGTAPRAPPGDGGGERGARTARPQRPAPPWPRALRAVRAWLTPRITLRRWWTAWSNAPPPAQLQDLMTSLQAGHGLHLYIRN